MKLTLPLAALLLLLGSCASVVRPPQLIPPTTAPFDYADWAGVLGEHVDEEGRIDYGALAADRDGLDAFYGRLAAASPDSHPELFPDEDDRLAYWINAYNAGAIVLVLVHWPIESVQDVRGGLSAFLPDGAGFFYSSEIVLGGEAISLYALENEVVRGRFPDPRIHFALNCASLGCPVLPAEPFLPERLDEQLAREARRFFTRPENVSIDLAAQEVRLSEILDWYAEDFTLWNDGGAAPAGSLPEYAARYVPDELANRLRAAAREEYEVVFEPYDWRLNAR